MLNKVNNFNLPKEKKEILKNLGKSNHCESVITAGGAFSRFFFFFFFTCLHLETQISFIASNRYFRHASGELYVISRALAKFVSINRSVPFFYLVLGFLTVSS